MCISFTPVLTGEIVSFGVCLDAECCPTESLDVRLLAGHRDIVLSLADNLSGRMLASVQKIVLLVSGPRKMLNWAGGA
jgi:hypothetical protein